MHLLLFNLKAFQLLSCYITNQRRFSRDKGRKQSCQVLSRTPGKGAKEEWIEKWLRAQLLIKRTWHFCIERTEQWLWRPFCSVKDVLASLVKDFNSCYFLTARCCLQPMWHLIITASHLISPFWNWQKEAPPYLIWSLLWPICFVKECLFPKDLKALCNVYKCPKINSKLSSQLKKNIFSTFSHQIS